MISMTFSALAREGVSAAEPGPVRARIDLEVTKRVPSHLAMVTTMSSPGRR
jgi:hypothetical protein